MGYWLIRIKSRVELHNLLGVIGENKNIPTAMLEVISEETHSHEADEGDDEEDKE